MIPCCAAPACAPPAWLGAATPSARTFRPISCAPSAFSKLLSLFPLPTAPAACSPSPFAMPPLPPSRGKRPPPPSSSNTARQARAARLGQRAREQIRELRAALDADPASAARRLLVAFDGGYTNQTVLKHLPPNTTAIGRLRQDAHLLFRPDPATQKARGRRLCYGSPAPTPEQVRTDDSPWQTFTFPTTAPPINCASNAAPA